MAGEELSSNSEVNSVRESKQIAEVINLAQARQAASRDQIKLVPRGRFVGAAGFVMLATALVFGVYITYQAARIGALDHSFVLGAFAITGTYMIGGALMVKLTGVLTGTSRLSEALSAAGGNTATLEVVEDEDCSPILLAFPELQTTSSGSFSLRCSQCGATYKATNGNVNCSDCGRVAQAG